MTNFGVIGQTSNTDSDFVSLFSFGGASYAQIDMGDMIFAPGEWSQAEIMKGSRWLGKMWAIPVA